ncbi:TSUP family transporter, partial [Rubrobacter aplysinae]|uniref:TSUP family transporter n=1 Tax=Rubrobacter aplysinae TaxID=909625 RepID=UPI00064BCA89
MTTLGIADIGIWGALLLVGAGVLSGALNAAAGGGSLISFPALLLVGYPPILANVTNNVAAWPGYVGGAWGYR